MTAKSSWAIPLVELEEYQRAVRLVLEHPLITARHPDEKALRLIRKWAPTMRADLADQLDYRLEIYATCARLVRVYDEFLPTHGLRTIREGRSGRPFDRTRYTYLCLTLAALDRAGAQVTLTELAAEVTVTAQGLDIAFDPAVYADRLALVDVVSWLEQVGALSLADSTTTAWVSRPDEGEVLYDIDRAVAAAIYRPTVVAQHLSSADDLLARPVTHSRDRRRQDAARRARRLLVEQPVVLDAEIDLDARRNLRQGQAALLDVERLTGARVERRAEGHALIDPPGGRLTDQLFPTHSHVSAGALLLVTEIADHLADAAAPPLPRLPVPTRLEARHDLARRLDACRPAAATTHPVGSDAAGTIAPDACDESTEAADSADGADTAERLLVPLVTDTWLTEAVRRILDAHPDGFSGVRSEPQLFAADIIDLLERMHLVVRTDGGVLALPPLARYRNTTAAVRSPTPSAAEPTLFEADPPDGDVEDDADGERGDKP